jgi:hypothetical protein
LKAPPCHTEQHSGFGEAENAQEENWRNVPFTEKEIRLGGLPA